MRALRLFLLCFSVLFEVTAAAGPARVVFLGGGSDSEMLAEAFAELNLPEAIDFQYRCVQVDPPEAIERCAQQADILIINALVKELRELAANRIDRSKTRLYALASRRLPAAVGALEPEEVQAYRATRSPANYRNLVRWIIHQELDQTVRFEPPVTLPEIGVTHPDAGVIFSSIAEYRQWAEATGHARPDNGTVAFAVHAASINPSELDLFRHLTREFERQQLNVAIVYGDEVRVIRELLLDRAKKPTVDAVLALSFKFKSGLGEALRSALADLDLPVFNALRLYRQTTPEWEASPRGMNDFAVAFGFIAPEISGLIEPSLLFGNRTTVDAEGRKIQTAEPFPDAIRITASRLRQWINLRKMPDSEKNVAIFLYNGSGGKQNIGASYLNVPRSLSVIADALARAGYATGGLEKLSETELTAEMLRTARNVGSWAPGELDALAASGDAVRLPRARYAEWFAELPEALRNDVVEQWGPPENAAIMTVGGDFILPMLRRGRLTILPEPMRGWLDDPHKLLHSATLAPHHQYLAVYLWLRHEFQANAMIHLGRHGSSEWLPGKQLGLSDACAPWVVRGDIVEIYPYIADGIGEGVVAKRRAAAVMIDHLTPFLRIPPEDEFLSELRQRLGDCRSADPGVRRQREAALLQFAREHRLTERLHLDPEGDWLEKLEEYAEHRESPAPFGLHTFGVAPSEAEIAAMTALLPEARRDAAAADLRRAGTDEITALLRALDGRFIAPGPSGDPVRNPDMLPVGRNFYSFDPALIPTAEAMTLGRKLADELLEREIRKHGRWPRQIAIILWAGETVRTDGVNAAMALALMGMRLQYDANRRIVGVTPVPGAELNRPRIDVLITASGACRDQFGDLLQLLDRAQRQASRLNDAENFIRRNTEESAARLKAEGRSAAEIADWSTRRIFFPAPGTYGTRVNKLAGASGLWEKDDELAALYQRSMASSIDDRGEIGAAPAALAANLTHVDAMFHSRSSNVYGVTDIDDMYQYFGGLSLAVRKNSGKAPGEYIVDQRRKSAEKITALDDFMAAELDSRLYNQAWIQAMAAERYSGGKTIARMTDNLWGWQTVTPDNVSAADWTRLYEIYVKDRYQLNLKEFFADNAWAFQSMTGRMLEAVRKDYWNADTATRQSLAAEYAQNVIRYGMACCDHTCNNPLLNQMVVNLISMPGVLSPELVMKFQAAVEKAAAKTLDAQVRERRELRQKLAESFAATGNGRRKEVSSPAEASRESAPQQQDAVPVKGFRMKPEKAAEHTALSSSGLKWTILAAVFALLAVFAWGASRNEE